MQEFQRTLAVKCQGEEGYKDRVMVVVCCIADGRENFVHWKVWKTTLLERFGALPI